MYESRAAFRFPGAAGDRCRSTQWEPVDTRWAPLSRSFVDALVRVLVVSSLWSILNGAEQKSPTCTVLSQSSIGPGDLFLLTNTDIMLRRQQWFQPVCDEPPRADGCSDSSVIVELVTRMWLVSRQESTVSRLYSVYWIPVTYLTVAYTHLFWEPGRVQTPELVYIRIMGPERSRHASTASAEGRIITLPSDK